MLSGGRRAATRAEELPMTPIDGMLEAPTVPAAVERPPPPRLPSAPPGHASRARRRGSFVALALVLGGLGAGAAAWLAGEATLAELLWGATTAVALAPLLWGVLRDLRSGRFGVDVIALLSMGGALLLGQHLAGAVVALMLSGGQVLEAFAAGRARRELAALVSRAPRLAHRHEDGAVADVALAEVRPGDRLLVKSGEVVPVDGVVAAGSALLDEAALTGEAVPVVRGEQERVKSGVVNAGPAFDLLATAGAEQSTYAAIVRLVEAAQAAKAPMVRLADRWALWFLPLTVAAAGGAWALSGDPVRALAVLVVATPCPLILAVPVAVIAGISRAARRGVLVKGGGALETLARGSVLVLDKTGTVSGGSPVVTEVVPFGAIPSDELLRLAASLDLASAHVLAQALVEAARGRGLRLSFPRHAEERLGTGIHGEVDGRRVAVGQATWVAGGALLPPPARRLQRRAAVEGLTAVLVAVDGAVAGALLLQDPLRTDAPGTVRALRRAGFGKVVLLTGDHREMAEIAAAALGVDSALAERSPEDKVAAVRALLPEGVVVMVGDGINDAAALAAADVGVAMGARGASASSEAADVVLVPDRLDRLVEALTIARRSHRIALQSVAAGMALSLLAMAAAALGALPPVAGALLQEGIDVAVILNALRALGDGKRRRRDDAEGARVGAVVRGEHRLLLPRLRELRQLADRLDRLPPAQAFAELREAERFLVHELLPHERREDLALYPVVERRLGGLDPTAPMSRAHLEIAHLVGRFERLLADLPPSGPGADDMPELRRLLYGLDALLHLHFAQEEESYLPLLEG
jgi:heavy metal translocating P-type ATPase